MEETFSDYRDVDGLQVALKAVLRRVGASLVEAPVRDVRVQRPARSCALRANIPLDSTAVHAKCGPRPLRVMISCGEPSGDLYAGALARELRRLDPAVADHRIRRRPAARGGRHAGRRLQRPVGHRPARGGARPAAHLRHRTGGWSRDAADIAARTCSSPSISPTSTSGWRAQMRKLGIPVVYYISPQLWAWRPGPA